jgi:hypothetical protein
MCGEEDVREVILKSFLADLAVAGGRSHGIELSRGGGQTEVRVLLETPLKLFFELAFLMLEVLAAVLLG